MKKIILLFILSIIPFTGSYAWYSQDRVIEWETYKYKQENIKFIEEVREKELEILKLDDDYEKYKLFIEKTKLEIQIKENEKDILCIENAIRGCNLVEASNDIRYELEKYNDEILHLKNILEVYLEKFEFLEAEFKEELEKQKLEEQQKRELEQEQQILQKKEERAEEYLWRAEKKLEKWDIKGSISAYRNSCNNKETFECYYGLWVANFQLAQVYQQKISNYWYERLFENTIQESVSSLEKSLELTENWEKKENVTKLLDTIKNYPDNIKEEAEKQKVDNLKEGNINKKAEVIWGRLERITSTYSEEKKLSLYSRLIIKLESYQVKTKNQELRDIIDSLILKLKDYTNE